LLPRCNTTSYAEMDIRFRGRCQPRRGLGSARMLTSHMRHRETTECLVWITLFSSIARPWCETGGRERT